MAKAMSAQNRVTPSANGLAAVAKAASGKKLPPVQDWNPPFSGDLDIQIKRDGTWIHEGGVIGRPEMVRLFASILKLEGGEYFLVTPVEKVGIQVEDVPFVAVDFEATGEGATQVLSFTTNVGDVVVVGGGTPVRCEISDASDEPAPYVMVRHGLEARIDRKSFYRMVDLSVEHDGQIGLWSNEVFFPLMQADA
jgi:hypothetical protein